MADVRERDVEAVARWHHEAYRRLVNPESGEWKSLSETTKDIYRAVARALLADPPLALRRRVRELEGK